MPRNTRGDVRFLRDLGLFGVLLALLAVLYNLGTFNALLRVVGQYMASRVLKVPVTVGAALVTVDGQLELHDCVIHCAVEQAGQWAEPYLVSVKRIRIVCDPLSLLGKTWKFSEFCVEGIKLQVQKKDGVLNFAALGGDKDEADAEAAEPAANSTAAIVATPSDQQKPVPQQLQALTTTTTATVTATAVSTVKMADDNVTQVASEIVAVQKEQQAIAAAQAKLGASLITGLFGSLKAGAEQLQQEIQTSGGAEAWATNRLRTKVTEMRQRVDSEGGLQSFVVNQLKNTKDMVSSHVQRYTDGVQRLQVQEVHHIVRGEASRMPMDDGDPNEPRFLVDDFRIVSVEVNLRDVLPPHLNGLEAKPVTIKLVHMTHIGHAASPRSGGGRSGSFTEAGTPDTPTSGRSTSRRAPPGKLGVTADYLRWLIEREVIAAALSQAAPEVLYSGLSEFGKGIHKRTWEPLQSMMQPAFGVDQPLAIADVSVNTETSVTI